jgi:hypothetical protein
MPDSPVSRLDHARIVLVNPPIRLEEIYGDYVP